MKFKLVEELNSKSSNLGYRTEIAYGSGVRDLEKIIRYEIEELNNLDIPDTLVFKWDLTQLEKETIQDFTDNFFDKYIDDKQKQEEIIKICLNIIKREYPNAKYALWLTNKDVVKKLYGGQDNNIDTYEIKNTKPISDLGFDGGLYVYDEIPKPINKIQENNQYKGYDEKTIINKVKTYIEEKIQDNYFDVKIKELTIIGSRAHNRYREDSDIDILLEYEGTEREDDVFNLLHETPFYIGNMLVDINPINSEDQTTAEYIEKDKEYEKQKIAESIDENTEDKIIQEYGLTNKWSETGYILKNGQRIDLSGRKFGGQGNRRDIDHREPFEDGTEDMIEFIKLGNIRVSPETPGINLYKEPTKEQYQAVRDFIEQIGYRNDYFSFDLDDGKGYTKESKEYEGNISAPKIIKDLKYYFANGQFPQESELSQFRGGL